MCAPNTHCFVENTITFLTLDTQQQQYVGKMVNVWFNWGKLAQNQLNLDNTGQQSVKMPVLLYQNELYTCILKFTLYFCIMVWQSFLT